MFPLSRIRQDCTFNEHAGFFLNQISLVAQSIWMPDEMYILISVSTVFQTNKLSTKVNL